MKIGYISISNFRGIKALSETLKGNFICIIGSGDSCKSTILTAIEYALSPKWNVSFDDSDFFNQDVNNPIEISIALYNWDEDNPRAKKFFQEGKFGQFVSGLNATGPTVEPIGDAIPSILIKLEVSKSLEPSWYIVKGDEKKSLSSEDRQIFGLGRIGIHLDNNFTWGRNSILTKLTSKESESLSQVLSDIARVARDNNIEHEASKAIAANVKDEAVKIGVKLNNVTPRIDIQKAALATGALSLHEENVPLRNFGTGSKKLISCAMQIKLQEGKNLTLIDELELGLEPHRIRGLIQNLKSTDQQVITTTHSSVVIRELIVEKNELYVCQRQSDGTVFLKSVADVPEAQNAVRSNAEAFLGRKIIVCEGPTEIGCLRALDELKLSLGNVPVWTLNTAYFNAGGIGKVKTSALKLKELGYDIAVFCDNDTPDQFKQEDIDELSSKSIPVYCWDDSNAIENQLFLDLKTESLAAMIEKTSEIRGKSIESHIASIKAKIDGLHDDYKTWSDVENLTLKIGYLAGGKNIDGLKGNSSAWFKRIDLAEEIFKFAIPNLKPESIMVKKLDQIWSWVQNA